MSMEFENRQKIDAICNQFEEAWSPAKRPEFAHFLFQVEPDVRQPLLSAILGVDVELRNKAGLTIDPNDYRELGDDAVAVVNELMAAHSLNRDEATTDAAPNRAALSSKQIGPHKLTQPADRHHAPGCQRFCSARPVQFLKVQYSWAFALIVRVPPLLNNRAQYQEWLSQIGR